MKKFLLRLDPVLYKKVEKLAKENHRSINKEIEYILFNNTKKVKVKEDK